ncbi:DNA packaging tegument protein UL17 [Falconid herpesvirus 1]|uniref:DNA packaging tegument protein UL17 n=1 Tax=Falconid herpesvirus 1 TaxID=1510155 RepID=A0A068ER17_9ALPH|nr:DNA packaging tegument protein UL17 [Falconid herpesvirus 1]AID52717.1 DNA packaging tegument protein UL17 [Falconid herpesvirus 1]
METHVSNETRYLIQTGGPEGSTARLVHLVITDACISAVGIDVGALKELVVNRRAAGTSPNQTEVRVEVQTRFHATGACTDWERADATYVSSGALVGVLIPSVPGLAGVFAATRRDAGGLFVSLPVKCDDKGRFDPFNVSVIRLCTTPPGVDYPSFADIEFTYEELLPGGTRYEADERRTTALCLQFIRHSGRAERRFGAVIAELRAKMESLLSGDIRRGDAAAGDAVAVDVIDIAESSTPFDDPQTASRIEEDNRELNALIRKAANAINRRRPVGRGATRSTAGVVSGLRQGALAVLDESGGGDARTAGTDQGAVLSGLEPIGSGRFVGGTAGSNRLERRLDRGPAITQALEDVLLFDGLDRAPLSPRDVLGIAMAVMSGGSAPDDEWRRRPISVVPRTHFGTGRRFYVISYEPSMAWGGRGHGSTSTMATSLGKMLAEACAAAKVARPIELGPAERRKLAEDAPVLADALGLTDAPLPLRPFSVGAEAELRARFRAACSSAVARAVGETLKTRPALRQLLSYDVVDKHEIFIHVTADRAPTMIASCVMAAVEERDASFARGALANATLAYLASDPASPYVTYATGRHAGRPALEYAKATAEGGLFAFDYYSSGGECVKVSSRPIPVIMEDVDRLRNAGQGAAAQPQSRSCRFPPWFAGRAVCERHLPGESYAYTCLGYNERLDILVVLPGGFALYLNAAKHFHWSRDLTEAVLARAFRRGAERALSARPYKY